MRRFSRIFAYLLLAVLVLGACTPQSSSAPAETEAAAVEEPAAVEETAAPAEPAAAEAPAATEAPAEAAALPDLGGRKVTVAVENAYPPFNMIDPDTNEAKGWDYDTLPEICKRVNCVAEFVQVAWDGIFPAMQAGEFDVLADGITITAERDEIIDFSIPYVTTIQGLLVRSDETADLAAIQADENKLISTQLGTTNEIVAKEYFPVERIKSFEDFGSAVMALLSGDVDAVVIDNVTAAGYITENPDKLKITATLTSDEALGFVFPPGSELKAAFDAALESMKADGTLEEINKKWGLVQ